MDIGKNIRGAVVPGWGRQISENSGLTKGIAAKTVITCHWTCNKIKQRARTASVRALSLPWTEVDFIIITIHHSSPFFSVAVQSIRNICILKAEVIVLKRQLLKALRRISLHRCLRSSSNSVDQVCRRLLLGKDGCMLAGRTIKKQCCWDYGPKILTALNTGKPEKRETTSGDKNSWGIVGS